MNRKRLLLVAVLVTVSLTAWSWGFWAHRKINRMACFSLPPGMVGFYKRNIEFLTTHAVDPDMRRYAVAEEAPRHYIDLDHYGDNPFDSLPKTWNAAVQKYSEDTLMAYGIVPWYICRMLDRLTGAFRRNDRGLVLYYSANIGHYIADAHVPLHCTENYNGQLTNQRGIHGFWESRLPELFGDRYDYFAGRSRYLDDPQQEAWDIVGASFAAHDSVLRLERMLSSTFKADGKYAFVQRGGSTVKTYSEEYSEAYSALLNGMVERRMQQAIVSVGSYWYTAWVNAGSPDLERMESSAFSDSLDARIKEEEYLWKHGRLKGSHGHEEKETAE